MNHDFMISKIKLACYVPKGAGARIHKNRANHGLAFQLKGEKTYLFDSGAQVDLCENKIIYLPKGSSYEICRRVSGNCYAINFELAEDALIEPFSVRVKSADRILSLFKSCQQLWKIREQGYEMECKANLYHILAILQQEAALEYAPAEKAQIIAPAMEYLRANYTEPDLTIAYLADLCRITPEYFRKIFKSTYGDSPLSYINRKRLANAKNLLDSGMYTITDAAEASGYTDMSHFSRAFKSAFTLCPRDYVKEL